MTDEDIILKLAAINSRLVAVAGTLMMVATSNGRLPRQPAEHEADCDCQVCRAFLAVQQSQNELDAVEKALKDRV